jgi:hypothetical protein
MYVELESIGSAQIKETPDLSAAAIGLDKYEKSKIPGTFEIIYPSKGRDGRWLTGIDEESHEFALLVTSEDPEQRKKGEMLKGKVKKLRERLQVQLGIANLKADRDNSYWATFKINLRTFQNINLGLPEHQIALRCLLASGNVMRDLSERNHPRNLHTKFYLHNEAAEVKRKVEESSDKDTAMADVHILYRNDDPKLREICKIIFPGVTAIAKMSVSELYSQVKIWLITEKKQDNSKEFNLLNKLSNTDLGLRIIVKSASARGLITHKNKVFMYGQNVLGKTMEDVYRNLLKDDLSAILQDITERLEKS